MSNSNPTDAAIERAVASLIKDATRLAKVRGVSVSTISRMLFGDPRAIAGLEDGSRTMSIGRLQRAAARILEIKETK